MRRDIIPCAFSMLRISGNEASIFLNWHGEKDTIFKIRIFGVMA